MLDKLYAASSRGDEGRRSSSCGTHVRQCAFFGGGDGGAEDSCEPQHLAFFTERLFGRLRCWLRDKTEAGSLMGGEGGEGGLGLILGCMAGDDSGRLPLPNVRHKKDGVEESR